MKKIVIATRGSQLALWQANHIKAELEALRPGLEVELLILKTKGDIILDVPLAKVGGKGLFVKEIEDALLNGQADLAVHSMKDVPMELPAGLLLGCVPRRESPRDLFLSHQWNNLDELPQGSTVGTSSLRRQAQLLAMRPDLKIVSLRGNVDTRLRKLAEGQFSAIILAEAGVKRLGLSAPMMTALEPLSFIPAVGQGALGIECRADRPDVLELLRPLEDRSARICVEAERGFLAGLEGGCQAPIAGHAVMTGADEFSLEGLVCDLDGTGAVRMNAAGREDNARETGLALARKVLDAGGRSIMDKLYS